MEDRVNWKEMYLTLARATEEANRTLIKAQLLCEHMYMTATDENGSSPLKYIVKDFAEKINE